MKLNNFKKFNICLSILIIIDLVLISFTLISRVPINIYYGIIVFDTIVCIVLWNDFFTRLSQSNNKKRFILKNWLEIMAAIPFDLIMMPFALNAYNLRLLKILRFIKIMALFSQFLETIDVFLKKTHLDEVFGVTLLVVLASTLGLYLFDSSINSLFDSLWFVLSTITTVGYGDVMPQTAIGKTIGLITLIIGVLLFSAVTGAMATYFAGRLFANPDFNITKNDDNIEILKEDLSFNKENLNSVHKKVNMIDDDLNHLKKELEEMKELNKELREEIRSLNENLKK
ncbi:MAG: ion channel [Methanobrevibacter sp.]|nr:ion channel [Methanobrevibacter sp.]